MGFYVPIKPILNQKDRKSKIRLILHCRVSVVYPLDGAAGWEFQLSVVAQLHKTVSYHISLTWEKIKIQKSKYGFY